MQRGCVPACATAASVHRDPTKGILSRRVVGTTREYPLDPTLPNRTSEALLVQAAAHTSRHALSARTTLLLLRIAVEATTSYATADQVPGRVDCGSFRTQLSCDIHSFACRWNQARRQCVPKSTPPSPPGPPRPPPSPPSPPSPWTAWSWNANGTIYRDPSFNGAGIASDPAVLYDDDAQMYRMYYTCIDSNPPPVNWHLLICSATSPDGTKWTVAPNRKGGYSKQVEGVALDWQGAWYTDLETAFVYLDKTERLGKGMRWVMYADAYVRPKSGEAMESDLVMAVSTNGVTFEAWPPHALRGSIVPRTKGGWDNNQQASPTLLTDPRDATNKTVLMMYVGHCTANCTATGGASYWFGILGASSTDLVSWKKEPDPVVPWGGEAPSWAVFNGEPGWVFGPDGYFYVFPSGGFNRKPPVENFGIARSTHPFTDYVISESPIVAHGPPGSTSSAAVFAPSAMLDPRVDPGNLTARVWYFQGVVCPQNEWCPPTINEATAPWPLFSDTR